MHTPISWVGGKGRFAPRILPLFPPHVTYVEPFGGGAGLLLKKAPSPIEVYNDMDQGLVNFFRALRDPAAFEQFSRFVSLTPYSRQEHADNLACWAETVDPVERAARWFVVARNSFGGGFGNSWGFSRTTSSRGMAGAVSSWLGAIDSLVEVATRLREIQIEHGDFRGVLERFDTPTTLFYCDPPYVLETRAGGKAYKHELQLADHADLVERLLRLSGMAIISGYYHEVYAPLEAAGWLRIDWPTSCHSSGRTRGNGILGVGAAAATQARTESLWISPTAQAALPGAQAVLPLTEQ